MATVRLVRVLMTLLFCASTAAHAVNGEWTVVVSTCTPDEDSAGRYEFETSAFQFKGTNVGTITARCNVTDPDDYVPPEGGATGVSDPVWNRIEVTYFDPDGNLLGVGARATVSLRGVDKNTGEEYLVKTFNSDTYNTVGIRLRETSIPVAHHFNFVRYAYYVALQLTRTVGDSPKLFRVRLYRAPVVPGNPG